MATRIRLRLARTELRAVLAHDAGKFVALATNRVKNRAQVLAPVDTGTLRSRHSIDLSLRQNRAVGRVLVRVRYAAAVHEGWRQGPRIIRPRRKKALRFRYQGKTVIVRQVRWPGARYRGRPWLRTALYEVTGPLGFKLSPGRRTGT